MSTNHDNADRIVLTGLSARGYHGLLPFERTEGQLFTADVTVFLGERGTAVAAVTDSLDDAVNYVDIAREVVGVIEGEPVGLLETLAERISDAVLALPRVSAVEVTVHKPQAPLDVAFDDVSVSIARDADSAAEMTPAAEPGAAAFNAVPTAAAAPLAAAAPAAEPGAVADAAEPVAESRPVVEPLAQPHVESAAQPAEVGAAQPAVPAEAPVAPELPDLAAGTPLPPVPAAPFAAPPAAPAGGPLSAGPVAPSEPGVAQPPAVAPTGTPEAPAVAPVPPQPPVDPLTVHPQAPVQLVIALGGNVGGVVPSLRTAVNTLRQTDGITVTTVAPLARTAAVVSDGVEQPDYLNTVVLATTTLSPREVLAVCQGLEAAAGRVRTRPQGPRTLDADIITYEGVTSTDPELTLPHPRAAQRAFVLVPWAQADPFAEIGDQSVAALAESAPDRDGVRWLALDWLDSDHLPALPTGQYVAPPEAEPEPVAPVEPEAAVAPESAAPVEPVAPAEPEAAPSADADPAEAARAVPAEPEQAAQQQPVVPAAPAQPVPVEPARPEPIAPAQAEPVVPPQPDQNQPEPPAAPRFSGDGDAAGADAGEWTAPPAWNDVIGRNGRDL
ncbi:2-amino-4-hydroxy-6-hydroxymethyldihydropteridine diphosphokinase [Actinomyces sp. Z5]|uniref:2-amino-4-hydroxy-6- hydroxymethyldihydropteridine diphosphokinase n=1 Tax=Actinomyces sp. Z5 TaxID=2250216 RepID=UPI000DCC7B7E|nr:2-amino-4-hydroxy-6-hydroxymethyldihydropteridine diphosphokinase [Actinomyces sp. Z5]RAX19810.1 2-amino-4-hydroxy-6-hydroxymethyldihydropteridine diphosphokinase [Actinomyces sp. Z5]